MITIHLLPRTEKLAPENPLGLKRRPLYHQIRTYEALAKYDLVANVYDTGTGKTQAALLHLLRLAEREGNVLFIAPTNALLHQHAQTVQEFVAAHDLDYLVVEMNASRLRRVMEEGERPGEALQHLINNPVAYGEALGADLDVSRRHPLILVVNPDIFYYALFFRYRGHDQRNMFQAFLVTFDYVIIDEFHYYDSKQLANFLFFFVLSQEFGYFEQGRRICLLSATPGVEVTTYLDDVFGDRWRLIAPRNEPAYSDDYPTLPVLTQLDVHIEAEEMQDWVDEHKDELRGWVTSDDGARDGVLISSALWRINRCWSMLQREVGPERVGRITGPEPEARRSQVTAYPLILATPTVDIGYNFQKLQKARQNVDFLVCDARYQDELIQRIGRAGRVLGKQQTDASSEAMALLPDGACRALRSYDGCTLSRQEFAGVLEETAALPTRQLLAAYIRSHAITECFYPIYQMGRMMPSDQQQELESLYKRVRDVFAPHSRRSAGGLRGFFSKHYHRQRWLRRNKETVRKNRATAHQVADMIYWKTRTEYRPAQLEPQLGELLPNEELVRQLREFVRGQVALVEALFSFRDAFQGPIAVVYDRGRLLSSQEINTYSLRHLISNYEIEWLEGRAEFSRYFGEPDERGDMYGIIRGYRQPRLRVGLGYRHEGSRGEFDQVWCHRPVPLRDLDLVAWEGKDVPFPLDSRVASVMRDRYVPALIIYDDEFGIAYSRFRASSIYLHRLQVRFPGAKERAYHAILGTQAFMADAELQGWFSWKERQEGDAIII